jgi:hypothetical protein
MKFRHILLFCGIATGVAGAGQLELSKKWIQQNMNHATTGEITFHVKEAKKSVNPISSGASDGDLHIAGGSAQTGLPMVAEIINGKMSAKAVQLAKESTNQDVKLNGVWRLWFEHPPSSGAKQKQFGDNPLTGPATNPDHMFEIHPISMIGGIDLAANLQRVDGYDAKPNDATFGNYESRLIDSWKVTADSVIIDSKKAGYNYADFVIRLNESPQEIVNDSARPEPGRYMAQAQVLDTDCTEIVDKKTKQQIISGPRRMVFVENDAKKVMGSAKAGSTFHVMGIPRINLERLVFYLNHPDQLDKKKPRLPYEMIIISATPQTCKNVAAAGAGAGRTKKSTSSAGKTKKKKA